MHATISTALAPLAYAWGAATRARRHLYRTGRLRSTRLSCPVISVGNLTMGGTGKTPIVAMIARDQRDRGKRVLVLSRGYRRVGHGRVVVADEGGVRVGLDAAGDEALMLARDLPGVMVVVAEDRAAAGLWAERELRPDIVVLDDGFQHLRLGRTCDIVVVDATAPLRQQRVLPAGRLREPPSALQYADAILISRSHRPHDQIGLRSAIRTHNTDSPIVGVSHRYGALVSVDGSVHDLARLSGRRIVALSAIGHPQQFESELASLGCEVVERVRFRDHHRYDARDLRTVAAVAQRSGAAIVTTTKDLVRIEAVRDAVAGVELWAVSVEATLHDWSELRRWLAADIMARDEVSP